MWVRGRGTLSLRVGHPFPISHWPLGTSSKPSVSTEHRLTTALENTRWGERPQTPGPRLGRSSCTPSQAILPPPRRERPFPPAGLCTHCLSWPPQVNLIPGPTYRSRSSPRAGPSPTHLLATSHLSGFSSGPLDTSSSPLSCGKLAGLSMGQR